MSLRGVFDCGVASCAHKRFDGLEQRFGFHHHSLATAEWPVIHGAVTVVREIAQIVHTSVDEFGLARAAHNTVIQRSCEELRKYRDDVESHRR